MSVPASTREDLRARVEAIEWYHTFELAPGLTTPGWFDTRTVAPRFPWPDLSGKRCLDVGTFDGFWAFEMERRGAAEVVAIDVLDPNGWDWPAGSSRETLEKLNERKRGGVGFEIAREVLGSSVERHERSIYDLNPAEIGTFDFVYVGSLLVHLRNPIGALDAVRSICRGRLMVVDGISLSLDALFRRRPTVVLDAVGRPWWWTPNRAAQVRMLESAGFEVESGPRIIFMPPGAAVPRPRPRPGLLRSHAGRDALMRAYKGDPHAVVLAKAV